MRVPVHCCCDPAKRLGWLTLDKPAVGKEYRFAIFTEPLPLMGSLTHSRCVGVMVVRVERLQLLVRPARLLDCGHYTIQVWRRLLAVKSDDRPIEDFRQLPAFEEEL